MKQDIILIGMPGCGKSTLGKKLAKALERPFLDLDTAIEAEAKKTIPTIFAEDGETAFRGLETAVFEHSLTGGQVIATGGGIVTRDENQRIARGGIVIFIDRPLEEIMKDVNTGTRPLLAEGKERLYGLYEARYDRYCAWADIHIQNTGIKETVLEHLLQEVMAYENYGD